MTVAVGCLLAFLFSAYAVRWWSVRGAIAQEGHYDNNNPRQQQARLTGLAARAQAAHQNALEAFAPFAAGVLVAQGYSDLDGWRDGLALAFLALRLVFVAAYLADRGSLRSAVWGLAFLVNLALFFLPLAG